MKVDVFNMEGKKLRQVDLPGALFEAPINIDLMHQAYIRQMANARLGTHSTKGRSEVSGGGRKPWRQPLVWLCKEIAADENAQTDDMQRTQQVVNETPLRYFTVLFGKK